MSKKLFTTYSTEEIADAFILTQKLTKKQQAEATQQLAEARKKSQQEFNESDRLFANLLQFKFKLEDYLKNEDLIRTQKEHSVQYKNGQTTAVI